jgi:hypothetical protein
MPLFPAVRHPAPALLPGKPYPLAAQSLNLTYTSCRPCHDLIISFFIYLSIRPSIQPSIHPSNHSFIHPSRSPKCSRSAANVVITSPDDVTILLKKFSVSPNKKTRQVAVIGQVALLCQVHQISQILLKDEVYNSTENQGRDTLNILLSDMIEQFHRQVLDEDCQFVLINELVLAVESGEITHKPFLQWLHMHMSSKYLDPFLRDDDEEETSSSSSSYLAIGYRSLAGLDKSEFILSIGR